MRRVLVFLVLVSVGLAFGQQGARDGQWRHYAGDPGSTKYSALDQITKDNVAKLAVAWRWTSPDEEVRIFKFPVPFVYEATPLYVDGTLYTSTSFCQVAAIDPATGKTRWKYDPGTRNKGTPTNLGFVHRGVAHWSDGKEARLFLGTGDGLLIALDAKTGKPCPDFGDAGRVDLTKGLRRPVDPKHYAVTSAPVVCRDVVVVGSSIVDFPMTKESPPGDVRGFDARSGKPAWTFHSVPQKGEVGNETWENDSWRYTGNTNAWAPMSADDDLGYVYVPFGTPTNDWYGGHRHGDNLFADSLVCLEAKTGKRVWHFQFVHHGLWDYDTPAAPTLVDITVDGKRIKAVAQVTKQGFCFVFDRVTGKPVWPIEERPVPASKVPGEKASPTQPFPTKPPPFERQGVREDDLIDFTPELRKQAVEILKGSDHGPLFTPPSEKGTINLPGWEGGANWQGAAFDPETGRLFVSSITSPIRVAVTKPDEKQKTDFAYLATLKFKVEGPEGLPLFKPPYGRITAIDLNKGEHAWQVPNGVGPRDHPALKEVKDLPARLGEPDRTALLCTKTLLFAGQAPRAGKLIHALRSGVPPADTSITYKPSLRAFDKATGELVAEVPLPDNVVGAPMTYLHDGKQYVAFAVGGLLNAAELVALRLP